MNQQAMRWGAVLPQGSNLELTGMDAAAAWRRVVEVAELAERLGYDHLWALDRVDTMPRREPDHVFEGWTTLAALSQSTSRARLGHLVTGVPFRNAGLLAKQAACLDVISGGRLLLALGAGGYPPEYESYGLRVGPDAERLAALAETVEAMRRLWSERRTTFEGRHVRLAEAHSFPKPLAGSVPIWIAGEGERVTLDVAARLGDGTLWRVSPDELRHKAAVLRQHCERAGRDPERITRSVFLECRIFDSSTERDRWLATPYVIVFWSTHPDNYVRHNLVGTVEAVTEQVQRYVDGGARELLLWFRDYPDSTSLERFMTEVVPKVGLPAPAQAVAGVR